MPRRTREQLQSMGEVPAGEVDNDDDGHEQLLLLERILDEMVWQDDTEAPAAGLPAAPRIGFTLALKPSTHEEQFLRSQASSTASITGDKWAAMLLIAANGVWFRWQLQLPYHVVPRVLFCVALWATSVIQLAWLNCAPASYCKHRRHFLLACRVIRVGTAWSLADMTTCFRAAANPSQHQRTFLRMTGSSRLAPALDAIGLTMTLTSSSAALCHAGAMPLPVLHQLAVQLLWFALIAACRLHITAALQLRQLAAPLHVKGTCRGLNQLLDILSLAYLGTTPGIDNINRQCDSGAEVVLVLFVMSFFGVVLPVRLAFKLELQQRLEYVRHHLQRTRQAARIRDQEDAGGLPSGGWLSDWVVAVSYEALLMSAVALQAWLLVHLAVHYLPWLLELPEWPLAHG